MVKNIGKNNTIFNQFIAEIRDAEIQKDSFRFRRNLERIGEIFAYEISKELNYTVKEVVTTLGTANVPVLTVAPVLATILRAGLPLHQGLLNFFDRSENGFVSAYRKYKKNGGFTIQVEYSSCPELTGKVLILSDPMLATGASMVATYKELLISGKPAHTHIVSVLACDEGIEYLKRNLPKNDYTLWVGAIDDELTAQAYIVPGLGDAGDLAFGKKAE
ncbi:MAG: uracil phosphoribosyltransferase [Lentimicrobiaceae bacterium]|nr:uracil phosphoribosyltransferase [Lentimicrobiaceae bacterium]